MAIFTLKNKKKHAIIKELINNETYLYYWKWI